MIPKTLHYIWLGGSKTLKVKQCIDSFHKFLSDYNLIEWNESNIDTSKFSTSLFKLYENSYKNKKYAFCSDIARLYILKQYGGIYVDTDVEFVKSIPDTMLKHNIIGRISPRNTVCNGCIWGCEENDDLIQRMIDQFSNRAESDSGLYGRKWIFNTLLMKRFKLSGDCIDNSRITYLLGYCIYPTEYFCPMNSKTGELTITDNTISIHHFDLSWKRS